jgi:hypothetical protein
MLLLVDNDEAEIAEFHGLTEQRMGADDNVERAGRKPLLDLGKLGGADESRCLRDLDRESMKAVRESPEMLTRQQRRRHHHRDLLARKRRDEGGAQRDLGLAEADIAADEAVHRPAGAKIVEHRIDCSALILGLVIGKFCTKLVIEALRRDKARRLAQAPLRRDLDQLSSHFADAALHPRLAGLPGDAAEPVEIDRDFLGPKTRQQLDVLYREKQLVVAGVMDLEAVVRRTRRFDGPEADEAPDAMIDMDHDVAGRERR